VCLTPPKNRPPIPRAPPPRLLTHQSTFHTTRNNTLSVSKLSSHHPPNSSLLLLYDEATSRLPPRMLCHGLCSYQQQSSLYYYYSLRKEATHFGELETQSPNEGGGTRTSVWDCILHNSLESKCRRGIIRTLCLHRIDHVCGLQQTKCGCRGRMSTK
jgi:hypothetical protein